MSTGADTEAVLDVFRKTGAEIAQKIAGDPR
jgi:hypothetical protein